jgi:hypothetical protein
LADSEDVLQCSVYNLQNIAKDLNMEISTENTKLMAFQGNYHICAKSVYTIKLLNKSAVLNILDIMSYENGKRYS